MRWIWIDRIEEFEPRHRALAVKNVSLAEEHLHDHWSAYPVMPTSLMIEGMAQTGGILVGQACDFAHDVVLAKITRADFSDIVVPGDQLTYEAVIENLADEAASIKGTVRKNGQVIGEITMMFSHANNSLAGLELPEGFVFTGSFQRMVEPFLEQSND
ncbi:MAG: beta-hydroxyacyl-ACP dehydratase [Planctomycetota bacterium]|nr:MAG: beta-hydroxyacyl-ACP dehydratase [Planctomycetota bacterium]